jgi:hypothetical protein
MAKRDEELHRLHDGELAEGALDRGQLTDEDRARLDAIAAVGAAVRNTLAAESRGVDVWADVERRIGRAGGSARRDAVRSWRERVRSSLRGHRMIFPALAVAAALGLAVWLAYPGGPSGPGGRGAAASNACDIEMLDVSGGSAAVIEVPDSDAEGHEKGRVTVIWTTEE